MVISLKKEGWRLQKPIKWICLLLPLIAFPFFALLGVVYGFTFDLTPQPAETAHFRMAIFSTVYAVTWLAYLFACMKWRIKLASWIYFAYWVCTDVILYLIQSNRIIRALAPLAILVLPFNGYSEKIIWGNVVCAIMLFLGLVVLVATYIGNKKKHSAEFENRSD